jgi:hypothetical protein
MRRNTNDWIARIFSIAAAGALPALAGCNESPTEHADMTRADLHASTDLELSEDLSLPTGDLGPMSVRRPFLVGSSFRSAQAVARHDWSEPMADAAPFDAATRRALAAAWLKDALEEHASVAAFARFSLYGLSVGAPPELVADAQRASLDEIRHARICFGLARRYGAEAAGPGRLRVDDALAAIDLTGLAVLTAKEGCVGETLGVRLAEEQARVALDPIVKEALLGIARDERRHAELAWRFVAWAGRAGGAPLLDRVAVAIRETLVEVRAMELRPLEVDAALWHAHGRLSCVEAKRVGEAAIVEIVEPALIALCGRRAA